MVTRFMNRAAQRDPALEQNLAALFIDDNRDNSLAQLASNPTNFRETAKDETRVFREYMVDEGVQQYKDYYETDAEEAGFFEHLDNLSNRERIRFMECFEDFTTKKMDKKEYVMIKKREYNPELSAIQNMILDLVDFKDRVRPLSRDLALLESTRKYQKQNVGELNKKVAEFKKLGDSMNAAEGNLLGHDDDFVQDRIREAYSTVQPVLSSDVSSSERFSLSEGTSEGSEIEFQEYRRRLDHFYTQEESMQELKEEHLVEETVYQALPSTDQSEEISHSEQSEAEHSSGEPAQRASAADVEEPAKEAAEEPVKEDDGDKKE